MPKDDLWASYPWDEPQEAPPAEPRTYGRPVEPVPPVLAVVFVLSLLALAGWLAWVSMPEPTPLVYNGSDRHSFETKLVRVEDLEIPPQGEFAEVPCWIEHYTNGKFWFRASDWDCDGVCEMHEWEDEDEGP